MDNGVTPLHIASYNSHLPVVKRLLQEKVDPNTPMNDGTTPLMVASFNGILMLYSYSSSIMLIQKYRHKLL